MIDYEEQLVKNVTESKKHLIQMMGKKGGAVYKRLKILIKTGDESLAGKEGNFERQAVWSQIR